MRHRSSAISQSPTNNQSIVKIIRTSSWYRKIFAAAHQSMMEIPPGEESRGAGVRDFRGDDFLDSLGWFDFPCNLRCQVVGACECLSYMRQCGVGWFPRRVPAATCNNEGGCLRWEAPALGRNRVSRPGMRRPGHTARHLTRLMVSTAIAATMAIAMAVGNTRL